jgi:hypothetical protein
MARPIKRTNWFPVGIHNRIAAEGIAILIFVLFLALKACSIKGLALDGDKCDFFPKSTGSESALRVDDSRRYL